MVVGVGRVRRCLAGRLDSWQKRVPAFKSGRSSSCCPCASSTRSQTSSFGFRGRVTYQSRDGQTDIMLAAKQEKDSGKRNQKMSRENGGIIFPRLMRVFFLPCCTSIVINLILTGPGKCQTKKERFLEEVR
ncbi:hypothetical protein HBI56_067090 [Parastagonospora nodorum]|uniref:Uncharacterized protein n=1 Tax=Phaeosphaeria nodorum (strain SN15 / ATCC MYA-4574 / FGSC 10173) TaxID=321614 RepID=A0A7U2HVF6_PHANO|nr:hypothetical protein HBH56_001590 [Parastagonospora nodorum]QRC90136.1 hypothetical protein JI435_400200 [Parastagonospora nodorum SN15]KAH3938170.1 hypothetical protein HBH54_001600 [Parastagonospora nodorum]KAH3940845.1 hypothetical protein HBH53_210900 [Parastagonospora nodorum]KAH3958499.1 hypothetical protein HBH51_209430 [Parastagonospora nodorum]